MTDYDRLIDDDRDETDPCERGTYGCCINHTEERNLDVDRATFNREFDSCETW